MMKKYPPHTNLNLELDFIGNQSMNINCLPNIENWMVHTMCIS